MKTLSVADAYLIHLLGEPLSIILKRLRKEEKRKNRNKINKLYLSLEVSRVGRVIVPTGEAVRRALEQICGADLHDYAKLKQTQLLNLGYDFGRYKTQITMHVKDQRELVDTFLGLRKDVKITNIETTETRFGIDLPTQPTSPVEGRLTLTPNPSDSCEISYRRDRIGNSATFKGTIVFLSAPVLTNGKIAALIRTEFFHIRWNFH